MKKLRILPALLLATSAAVLSAQEQPVTPERPAPISWSIQVGGGGMGQTDRSLDDRRRSAPNSTILQGAVPMGDDPGVFDKHPHVNGGGFLSITAGLRPFNKLRGGSRISSELRLGFQYSGRFNRSDSRYGETRFPHDTLVSQTTGEVVYMDSVITETYDFQQRAKMFGLDASLLLRAKAGKRFEFYGGMGLAGGMVVDPRTTITYDRKTYLEDAYTYSDRYYNEQLRSQEEEYTEGSGAWLLGYVPLGVDLRFGQQHEDGFEFHLFTEIHPGLHYLSLGTTGDQWSSSVDASLGVRLVLK